jgi:hypothetical protein
VLRRVVKDGEELRCNVCGCSSCGSGGRIRYNLVPNSPATSVMSRLVLIQLRITSVDSVRFTPHLTLFGHNGHPYLGDSPREGNLVACEWLSVDDGRSVCVE